MCLRADQGAGIAYGEMAELVEGARLEIVYTATAVSRVRIPLSPPKKGDEFFIAFFNET
jgi:hypothetical protein